MLNVEEGADLIKAKVKEKGWQSVLDALKEPFRKRLNYKLEPVFILEAFNPTLESWDNEVSKKVKLSAETFLEDKETVVTFFTSIVNNSWLDTIELISVDRCPEIPAGKGPFICSTKFVNLLRKLDPKQPDFEQGWNEKQGCLWEVKEHPVYFSRNHPEDCLYMFDIERGCGFFSFDVDLGYLEEDFANFKFKYKLIGPHNCKGYKIKV